MIRKKRDKLQQKLALKLANKELITPTDLPGETQESREGSNSPTISVGKTSHNAALSFG